MSTTLEDVVHMLRVIATKLQELDKRLVRIERDASELTDHFAVHSQQDGRRAALDLWRGHPSHSR